QLHRPHAGGDPKGLARSDQRDLRLLPRQAWRPAEMIRALALAVLLVLTAGAAEAKPTAVDGGFVEGTALPGGVSAWLGVPFAAPPVRELRWRPPQPVKPWRGVFHADRFAPECLQPLRSPLQNHYFGNEATSEDCLYLNIWAPSAARKAPVVVWIYGGGFN